MVFHLLDIVHFVHIFHLEYSDGGPLYVGRAEHEGGLFPGKVNFEPSPPAKSYLLGAKSAVTPLVLVLAQISHHAPPNPGVVATHLNATEKMFVKTRKTQNIQKTQHNTQIQIFKNKVNPEHDCCYIAYGGEEIAKEYYDVRLISPSPKKCF